MFSQSGNTWTARAQDVSERGIFVETGARLAVGEEIHCTVSMPENTHSMRGRVVWKKHHPSGVQAGLGISFVEAHPHDVMALRSYVATYGSESYPVQLWMEDEVLPRAANAILTQEGITVNLPVASCQVDKTIKFVFDGAENDLIVGKVKRVHFAPSPTHTVLQVEIAVEQPDLIYANSEPMILPASDPTFAESGMVAMSVDDERPLQAAGTLESVTTAPVYMDFDEIEQTPATQGPSLDTLLSSSRVHSAVSVEIEPLAYMPRSSREYSVPVDLPVDSVAPAAPSVSVPVVELPSQPAYMAVPEDVANYELRENPSAQPFKRRETHVVEDYSPLTAKTTRTKMPPVSQLLMVFVPVAVASALAIIAFMAWSDGNVFSRHELALQQRTAPKPAANTQPVSPVADLNGVTAAAIPPVGAVGEIATAGAPSQALVKTEPSAATIEPGGEAVEPAAQTPPTETAAAKNEPTTQESDDVVPRKASLVPPAGYSAERLVVVSGDKTGRVSLPITGSLEGAKHYHLANPDGIAITLPYAHSLVPFGTYPQNDGRIRMVWVRKHGDGIQVRAFTRGGVAKYKAFLGKAQVSLAISAENI